MTSENKDIIGILEEFGTRCRIQTGNEDLFLAAEGGKILAYIRNLESKLEIAVEALDQIEKFAERPCPHHQCKCDGTVPAMMKQALSRIRSL